ncbi:class I SAM-dependent DNA methyltransferase [Mammaliicoccus lentus]|uniref:class I SAM-dependent DNA methyltransferase n=1 Tax=Mammaliicoccus lentus TaxID=42858 RepID=UPI002DB98251|nr:class I SAM-dependent methyltransferase [Mammaliicoccus lentus]MEB8092115.1 class I SAM-dependent methyltransferase [Mammaliicoccus lentus]
MAYNRMSDYYDLLTADQPYHKWKYIVEHFFSSSENEILDIGCGTGTLTSQLTEYGQVSGVDISQEMLEIAESRNPSINWYCQDMRDLELPNQYDMITIFCDSLNYVTEPEDILQVFNYIDKYLKDEGIFIFDVHSIYKMNHQFNNQNYIDEEERLTLIWQAITGEEPNSVYHQMSFFVEREDGLYERFDEEHYQCTFEISLYEELLKLAGFEIKTKFTDFDIDTYSEQGDRQFIVAQKMNK